MAGEQSSYDGLSIEDIVPVNWEGADFSQSAFLEHANDDTARALQAIAVYEETPRSPKDDILHMPSDSSRLEAKVDLMISLLSNIVTEKVGMPPPRPIILRSGSLEWQLGPNSELVAGDTGVANVWMNTHLPLPLRLPCRLDAVIERNGHNWAQARFEFLSTSIRDGLGQVIFRHHRRQVAIARGTVVVKKPELV